MTTAARARKRRWEVANRQRLRQRKRIAYAERAAADPAWATERNRPTPSKLASRARYRERNRAREVERVARWARANPDRITAKNARRRGALVGTLVERELVLIRDSGICGICGLAVGPDWHLDHVVPLAKGGEHSYANTQLAHPRCNARKGARVPSAITVGSGP